MTLVVDASVALKWFVREDGSAAAVELLDRGEPLIAPDLVLAEVCNAAWKSLRRGQIDPSQFDEIANDISQVFQRLVTLDVSMITADRRRVAALRGTPFTQRVRSFA